MSRILASTVTSAVLIEQTEFLGCDKYYVALSMSEDAAYLLLIKLRLEIGMYLEVN